MNLSEDEQRAFARIEEQLRADGLRYEPTASAVPLGCAPPR